MLRNLQMLSSFWEVLTKLIALSTRSGWARSWMLGIRLKKGRKSPFSSLSMQLGESRTWDQRSSRWTKFHVMTLRLTSKTTRSIPQRLVLAKERQSISVSTIPQTRKSTTQRSRVKASNLYCQEECKDRISKTTNKITNDKTSPPLKVEMALIKAAIAP